MMQLVCLNFLILGGEFQIQKISIFFGNYIGRAAIQNAKKPGFLGEMAAWLKRLDNSKIPDCEKFTLSAQTSSAFQRTLLCQASLIEDLLSHGFKFVLTARFQSDSYKRRFGQNCQMVGGRSLVGLKYGVKGF